MEAEGSRSSGAADSYIGSLISLTSKSEIRYEGILFNINTEEASIGLQNVRSFGTEGRRKDGPQIPPIDKVYEYIVFRGSDIKDLQVKSSPPVQTGPPAPPVHNDPAIIQSHYTQAPTAAASTSLSSSSTGGVADSSTHVSQLGIPRSTFPSGPPLYQPGGGMGWPMPMYWQGYYGPSSSLQSQQHSLVQPPQGLPMPPSLQQPVQFPTMNAYVPTGAPNLPPLQSSEYPSPLLPAVGSSSLNMQSTMFPARSSDDSVPTNTPAQGPPVSQSTSLPLVSPSLSHTLDKNAVTSLVLDQAKPVSSPLMTYNSVTEPLSVVGGTSISPSLVTPGQFLQPGHTTIPLSQPPQIAQKYVEVVQVSSTASPPEPPPVVSSAPSASSSTEAQAPLLPLPSPANLKLNASSAHYRYANRGGRGRGRGHEYTQPVAKFTEDFDFDAMNEKFNKDEVWGHLGKSKANADAGNDVEDEDGVELSQVEIKPVYTKDDFFDTLSSNALDNESRNGRTRFSEQMRIDTETFGVFSRNRGFRGGRGPGRGGRARGGYYGRGYGYVGRGRGSHSAYHAI